MESTARTVTQDQKVTNCYIWTGGKMSVKKCEACDDTGCHFNDRYQEPIYSKAEQLFDRADRLVEKLAPYLFCAAMGYLGAHAVIWILR